MGSPPGGGHRRPRRPVDKAPWYLATNLPRPGGPREADSPHPAASLAEVTRIYGIRHWAEMVFTQVTKGRCGPSGEIGST
jgi:hypothetical protein